MGKSLRVSTQSFNYLNFSMNASPRANNCKNFTVATSWGIIHVSGHNFNMSYQTLMDIITSLSKRILPTIVVEILQQEGEFG